MTGANLTIEYVQEVLQEAGGLLRGGKHAPPPPGGAPCGVCARELLWLALCRLQGRDPSDGWTDRPDGIAAPTDCAVLALNDASWSSAEARTQACLPLVLLREADAAPGWVWAYAARVVRDVLPLALDAAVGDPWPLPQLCRKVSGLEEARAAARAVATAPVDGFDLCIVDAAGQALGALAPLRSPGKAAYGASSSVISVAGIVGHAAGPCSGADRFDAVLRAGAEALLAAHRGDPL